MSPIVTANFTCWLCHFVDFRGAFFDMAYLKYIPLNNSGCDSRLIRHIFSSVFSLKYRKIGTGSACGYYHIRLVVIAYPFLVLLWSLN